MARSSGLGAAGSGVFRLFVVVPALVAASLPAARARDTIRLGPAPRCADDWSPEQSGACNVCAACCAPWLEGLPGPCALCAARECHAPRWNTAVGPPKLHFAPGCLRQGGWHDVAGAITTDGGATHHVFMGCDSELHGWNHAVSTDFVTWESVRGAPRAINETRYGMWSHSTPCSGFVQLDDDGTPCAGFRQCWSYEGVNGTNTWDVPLEVRCSSDKLLAEWGEPEDLFNYTFYRATPYDPSKPWLDTDGNWYLLMSVDMCNATRYDDSKEHGKHNPCHLGGGVDLWRSPAFRGPRAKWERVGTMYQSNRTILDHAEGLVEEFVTVDYIGALPGDPLKGKTRVLFNNVGGNGGGLGCCSGTTSFIIGTQEPGGELLVDSDRPGAIGMVDWGSFFPANNDKFGVQALNGTASRVYSMARTLGSKDSNMVTVPGRRVMVAWLSGLNGAIMSLSRDLWLGLDSAGKAPTLYQGFVPEYQQLRVLSTHQKVSLHTPVESYAAKLVPPGQQAEIIASFTVKGGATKTGVEDFGIAVLGCASHEEATYISVHPRTGLIVVDGRSQKFSPQRAGPLEPPQAEVIEMDIILDTQVIEVIVNQRTAITVFVVPSSTACGEAWLYGVDGRKVTATVDTWKLDSMRTMRRGTKHAGNGGIRKAFTWRGSDERRPRQY